MSQIFDRSGFPRVAPFCCLGCGDDDNHNRLTDIKQREGKEINFFYNPFNFNKEPAFVEVNDARSILLLIEEEKKEEVVVVEEEEKVEEVEKEDGEQEKKLINEEKKVGNKKEENRDEEGIRDVKESLEVIFRATKINPPPPPHTLLPLQPLSISSGLCHSPQRIDKREDSLTSVTTQLFVETNETKYLFDAEKYCENKEWYPCSEELRLSSANSDSSESGTELKTSNEKEERESFVVTLNESCLKRGHIVGSYQIV